MVVRVVLHVMQLNPCKVCENAGFPEKIVTCCRCKRTREHVYCMRANLIIIPEIWICEVCRSGKEPFLDASSSPQPEIVNGEKIEPAGSNSLVGMADRLIHLRKDNAVGTDKPELTSGERSSNQKPGPSKMKRYTDMPPGIILGAKTASAHLSQKVRENPDVQFERHLKTPERGDEIHNPIPLRCCQIEALQNIRISMFTRKSPQPSGSNLENECVTSTSVDALHVIGSEGSTDFDANYDSSVLGGSQVVDALSKLETYDPNYPAPEAIWWGSFEISHSVYLSEFFDGFRAHVSSRVHCKAFEFAKQMPGVLPCTMLPISEIGLSMIPDLDNIALYFYPGNFERPRQQYERLLGLMETKDQAIRSHLSGVELVFPSTRLDEDPDGVRPFMWGLFCRAKSNVAVPPSSLPCNSTIQTQNSTTVLPPSLPPVSTIQTQNFNALTEVNRHCYDIKVEQLNNTDAPPGFPRKAVTEQLNISEAPPGFLKKAVTGEPDHLHN